MTNLRATEQALLGIMTRATTIADTLAVQTQLTTVRGQIEELQAQRNQLGDQAAFSTLTVQFEATPKTETTSATSGWNLNGTIDDATAALVKIGQGLASWAFGWSSSGCRSASGSSFCSWSIASSGGSGLGRLNRLRRLDPFGR